MNQNKYWTMIIVVDHKSGLLKLELPAIYKTRKACSKALDEYHFRFGNYLIDDGSCRCNYELVW